MATQDSGFHEVPSTPYLYENRFKNLLSEVPSSPLVNPRQNFQSRSQASSSFSREQDVPCTPAVSSPAISSCSTRSTTTVASQAEQTVPRTPRAVRIQNLKMLCSDGILASDANCSAANAASSTPGIKRSLEQKRRIEAIGSLRTVSVKHLFAKDNIFD